MGKKKLGGVNLLNVAYFLCFDLLIYSDKSWDIIFLHMQHRNKIEEGK